MKDETMKRLLSLIERTGDRMVITDPSGEHPYVIMTLDHYEKLVGGEWKPEAFKHDPTPPQALPISTTFPDNKPPKREIPAWKSTPSIAAPTNGPAQAVQPVVPVAPPPNAVIRPKSPFRPSMPLPTPAPHPGTRLPEPAQDATEGEEQFYLEALE
jgi:hypothetical protein